MLLAHFADTHLGLRLYGYDWIMGEVLDHFEEAVGKALKEHVDAILFSGDMFDTWSPPHRVIRRVIDVLRPASEAGVKIFAVLGEHDTPKRRDLPVHTLIPGIRLLNAEKDCFTVNGREYCVAGVNNVRLTAGRKAREALLARISKALQGTGDKRTILMLHQSISNFSQVEPGLDISELPISPVYIAMGHIHRRIRYNREAQIIAYPGSLDIVNIGELEYARREGKGFYLVDLSGDEPAVSPVNTTTLLIERIKTTIDRVGEDIVRAASMIPGNRRGIIYVNVVLDIDDKPRLEAIIHRIERRLGENIHLRIEKEYRDVEINPETLEIDTDKVAVKALLKILGDEKQEDLARMILALKDALVEGDQDSVRELVEEITKHPFWSKKIRAPQLDLTPTRPAGTQRKRTGRGGLLDYLG